MATDKSKDIGAINYQLSIHLLALSSTLDAFEVAAEASQDGSAKDIDPRGMFAQCNYAMTTILDLHQQLQEAGGF